MPLWRSDRVALLMQDWYVAGPYILRPWAQNVGLWYVVKWSATKRIAILESSWHYILLCMKCTRLNLYLSGIMFSWATYITLSNLLSKFHGAHGGMHMPLTMTYFYTESRVEAPITNRLRHFAPSFEKYKAMQ